MEGWLVGWLVTARQRERKKESERDTESVCVRTRERTRERDEETQKGMEWELERERERDCGCEYNCEDKRNDGKANTYSATASCVVLGTCAFFVWSDIITESRAGKWIKIWDAHYHQKRDAYIIWSHLKWTKTSESDRKKAFFFFFLLSYYKHVYINKYIN